MPSRRGLATLERVRLAFSLLFLLALATGCGPKRPPRYIIEDDLAGYHYRRYQKVLDVELPVAENPAVGHTATYVREGDPPEVVPVFITAYERAPGLTESIRQQLRGMDSYALDVRKLARENVWQLRGESGDVWLLWVSDHTVVKIGAPEGVPRVPTKVAEAYLELYPSDLDRKGRVKRRAESAGPARTELAAQAKQSEEREP